MGSATALDTINMCVSRSVISCSATPWTVAHHVSLSMGLPRQEYWSGMPFPSPGGLLDPKAKIIVKYSTVVRKYEVRSISYLCL